MIVERIISELSQDLQTWSTETVEPETPEKAVEISAQLNVKKQFSSRKRQPDEVDLFARKVAAKLRVLTDLLQVQAL